MSNSPTPEQSSNDGSIQGHEISARHPAAPPRRRLRGVFKATKYPRGAPRRRRAPAPAEYSRTKRPRRRGIRSRGTRGLLRRYAGVAAERLPGGVLKRNACSRNYGPKARRVSIGGAPTSAAAGSTPLKVKTFYLDDPPALVGDTPEEEGDSGIYAESAFPAEAPARPAQPWGANLRAPPVSSSFPSFSSTQRPSSLTFAGGDDGDGDGDGDDVYDFDGDADDLLRETGDDDFETPSPRAAAPAPAAAFDERPDIDLDAMIADFEDDDGGYSDSFEESDGEG